MTGFNLSGTKNPMRIELDLERALFEFRDAEIHAKNTPVFFTHELTVERIGIEARLDKVLNWWRSDDVWAPRERKNNSGVKCPFCPVLGNRERVFEFEDFISSDKITSKYAIIINNKWVFPNHFLVIADERNPHPPHKISRERIHLLCALAERLPSFMLYLTGRGMGVPQHFHGHLVKSEYHPPLVKAHFGGQHFKSLWKDKIACVSEIRYHPWTIETHKYVAGWAVTGPMMNIAEIVIKVAQTCTDLIYQNKDKMQTDIFWAPQLNPSEDIPVRTVFVFPRRGDGGKSKETLGATEFVGLFAFNNKQYFDYSVSNAIADLREAGLPWEESLKGKISEKISKW
ncbi:MAG: hypothetical protein ACE5IR_13260 [bacterium]